MALPNDPSTMPDLPQAPVGSDTWDPVTISNVVFSAIMVFIGIVAIWQAHRAARPRRRILDDEDAIGLQLLSRALSMAPDNPSDTAHEIPSSQHEGQIPPVYAIQNIDSAQTATPPAIDTVNSPSEPR